MLLLSNSIFSSSILSFDSNIFCKNLVPDHVLLCKCNFIAFIICFANAMLLSVHYRNVLLFLFILYCNGDCDILI
jgi:hypothetical protein